MVFSISTRRSSEVRSSPAVSSLTARPIKFDELGIDVLLAGTQKAFAMPPGLAVFAVTYLGFARAEAGPWFWLLFPVYGCYTALADSSLNAAIAERCAAQNRAAAMGLFQGTIGLLALVASLAAGWLWSHVSAAAPFYLGAACAAAAAPLLLLIPVRARS